MTIMVSVVVFITCFILLRNNLVFFIRAKRLNYMSDLPSDKWAAIYSDFDKLDYNNMVLDVSKWTYKQFYPDA